MTTEKFGQRLEKLDNPSRTQMNYPKLVYPDAYYLVAAAALVVIIGYFLGFWFGVLATIVAGICFIRLDLWRLYQAPAVLLQDLRKRRHPAVMLTPSDDQIDEPEQASPDEPAHEAASFVNGQPSGAAEQRLLQRAVTDNRDGKARASSANPFVVQRLPLSISGEGRALGDEMGIIHNRKRNTNSFVIVGSGNNRGMMSLDRFMLRQQLDQFANFLKAATYLPGSGITYSLLFRQDPVNVYEMATVNAGWQHPSVFNPKPLGDNPTRDEIRFHNIALNAIDGNQQIAKLGTKPWMAIVVTVRQDPAFRKAQKEGISVKQLPQLTVTILADAIMNGLQGLGVADTRLLDGPGIHEFLRGAWDTVGSQDYNLSLLMDPEQRYAARLHWPQRRMEAHHGYSLNDDTYTAVLRITAALPEINDTYWRQLFNLDVPHKAISVVNQAVRTRADIYVMDRVVNAAEQSQGWRRGIQSSLAIEADIQRKRDRRQSLYEAGVNQQTSVFVTLRGRSEEELTDYVRKTERFCGSPLLSMKASHVMSPSLQYQALWAGTAGLPW